MKNIFKKIMAFTMAEAILVMTILGIIATIMISTLKPAEFKEKALATMAKKILSEIDNATTLLTIESPYVTANDMADNPVTEKFFDMFKYPASDDMNAVLANQFKKYMTTIRKPANNGCFYLKDGAHMCVRTGYFIGDGANTIFPGEELEYALTANDIPVGDAYYGMILIDTNGDEEPNVLGKDKFNIPIQSNGIIYSN